MTKPPFDTRHYGIDYDRVYDPDEDVMVDQAHGQTKRIEASSAAEALIKLVDQCPTGIQQIHFVGVYEPGAENPSEIDGLDFQEHGIDSMCVMVPFVTDDFDVDEPLAVTKKDADEMTDYTNEKGFQRQTAWILCECGDRFGNRDEFKVHLNESS